MTASSPSLVQLLARHTREGELYEKLEGDRVRCVACGHRCLIPPGPRGHLPRALQRGRRAPRALRLRGRAAPRPRREEALLPRPARREGALVRHARAATCTAGSARTGSPRRRCATPAALAPVEEVSAREIVRAARRGGARLVTSTYNEPLITSEWAVEVFRLAKAEGLLCSYVSNGNGTEEVLEYLRPWVVALQGGPQGLPRPRLPRPRRHARARDLDDPRPPREGLLGGGGDPRRARLQRLGRGAARHRAVPRLGLTRRAVARDRLPPGLPDGRPRADLGRARSCGRRRSAPRRGCTSSTRATCPASCAAGRTRTAPAAGRCSSSASASACCATALGADGRCPDCRRVIPGVWA